MPNNEERIQGKGASSRSGKRAQPKKRSNAPAAEATKGSPPPEKGDVGHQSSQAAAGYSSAPCILADLDNTLIDTAVRKFRLLKARFPEPARGITIDQVRSDFWLTSVLGDPSTEKSKEFFELLDAEATVREYPAPMLPGMLSALKFFRSQGYRILVLTARPLALRSATLHELEAQGLALKESEVFFVEDHKGSGSSTKRELIQTLSSWNDILVVVGDRREDITAAHANGIPGLLLATTLTEEEINSLQRGDDLGLVICDSWEQVPAAVERVKSGSMEMQKLRDIFIENYANWLGDIDKKAAIGVTVAGAMAALSGKLLFDFANFPSGSEPTLEPTPVLSAVMLGATFLFSILSLLYSVRAYSSRHTSGKLAGRGVRGALKHWLGILFGGPQRFMEIEGDALQQLRELRQASEAQRSRAHLRFFYQRYGTYNVDGLKNLMLFDLRASNYQKLYAERCAAKLLVLAIMVLALWIGLRVTGIAGGGVPAGGLLDQPQSNGLDESIPDPGEPEEGQVGPDPVQTGLIGDSQTGDMGNSLVKQDRLTNGGDRCRGARRPGWMRDSVSSSCWRAAGSR